MKNRVEEKRKPQLIKITIDLTPEEHAGLKEMAEYMGVSVKQVLEALTSGQPEDYLARKTDNIWSGLIDYMVEYNGDSARLAFLRKYLATCNANGGSLK